MRAIVQPVAAVLSLMVCLALGACDRIGLDLEELEFEIPGLTTVTVELINDTNFDVDPDVRFDDDENVLAQIFPAKELTTGLLAPGQLLVFEFDCDELGLIFSDRAEQLDVFGFIAEADRSSILTRGDDFDCGDLIRFRFIGEFDWFGVVVSVNNLVVD